VRFQGAFLPRDFTLHDLLWPLKMQHFKGEAVIRISGYWYKRLLV
jgi:hypothetical protein